MSVLVPLRSSLAAPVETEFDVVPASATTKPAAPATAPVATTQPATQPVANEAQQRLQKLMSVPFDRSPAGVLNAMARPVDPKAEEPQRFAADVSAGRWDTVRELLASLPPDDGRKLHKHLVQQLTNANPQMPGQPGMPRGGPMPPGGMAPALLPDDVVALSDACPVEPEDDHVELIGQLLARTLARGNAPEALVARLDQGSRYFGGTDAKKRRRAADLLFWANLPMDAGKFLPTADAASAARDYATLDAQAKVQAAIAAATTDDAKKTEALKRSWDLTQSVLAQREIPAKLRDAAMARSLQLLPQLTKETGTQWLRESFARKPEQGRAVIANVGSSALQIFMTPDIEARRKALEQQKRVAEELLAAAGGADARPWAPALNILAVAWLQEAELTKQMPQPRQFNRGAYYDPYEEQQMMMRQQNPNQPQPVPAAQLLAAAPTEGWLALLDPTLAPKLRSTIIEINLLADEIDAAVPLIEAIAPQRPKVALGLANQLLTAWARVNNPNANDGGRFSRYGGYYSPYYNPYGMSQNGIPLTRSAQVRNLAELVKLLKRLRALPDADGQKLDETAVVSAFTAAHSQAEVFRKEDVEAVFGPIDAVPSKTLTPILTTMRERLARDWRTPQVQTQAKTKRTDKELQAEVTRGYTLLVDLLYKRLAKEQDWRLLTVLGLALFDWAEYDYGKEMPLEMYTMRRDRAFEQFKKAAELYKADLPKLKDAEESPYVYQQWFNASLGASDLAYLTRQQAPSSSQIEQIKAALFSLPEEAREKHVEGFGKGLTEMTQTLKPELKPRYLRAGIQIVGDHKSAEAARKLVKYYDDLLSEVALHVAVDGPPEVGHRTPFGVFVSVRHSAAIGRESGGFNKYLQNQQTSNSYYYYNSYPGSRGPVNYRDDFEKKIREALVEGFEIVSIIWQDDKANEPRGYGKGGWRETPLAYLLLKTKDASVDKLPPMQLDLDFIDKQGQVVLPVASEVTLIDSRPDKPPVRPFAKVQVTQTLDERDAANGKLTLDVKATARGLVPDLDELLDVSVPGFKVEKTQDIGLSVARMDSESDAPAAVSERSWLVNLVADPAAGGANRDAEFRFPVAKVTGAEMTYKRYADADVTEAAATVKLAGLPTGRGRRAMVIATVALLLFVAAVVGIVLGRRKPRGPAAGAGYTLPRTVTAFSVLQLLRKIESDATARLNEAHRAELRHMIDSVERRYFAKQNGDANGHTNGDLHRVAEQWVARANAPP